MIDGKRETEIRSGIKVLEGSAEQQVCSQSERWVQIRNGLIFLSKTADRMADVNLFFIFFFLLNLFKSPEFNFQKCHLSTRLNSVRPK